MFNRKLKQQIKALQDTNTFLIGGLSTMSQDVLEDQKLIKAQQTLLEAFAEYIVKQDKKGKKHGK